MRLARCCRRPATRSGGNRDAGRPAARAGLACRLHGRLHRQAPGSPRLPASHSSGHPGVARYSVHRGSGSGRTGHTAPRTVPPTARRGWGWQVQLARAEQVILVAVQVRPPAEQLTCLAASRPARGTGLPASVPLHRCPPRRTRRHPSAANRHSPTKSRMNCHAPARPPTAAAIRRSRQSCVVILPQGEARRKYGAAVIAEGTRR
jgi:hypothetical protein